MGAQSPGQDGRNHLDLMDTYHANAYDMDDEINLNYKRKKWSGDTKDSTDYSREGQVVDSLETVDYQR